MAHFLFLARATSGRLLSPQTIARMAQDLSTEWQTPAEIDRYWDESGTEQLLLINAKGGALVDANRLVLGTTRPPGPTAAAVAAEDPDEPRSVVLERRAERIELRLPQAAARRVWWHFAPDGMLIVTTLQRLALACLGGFEPNALAAGWALGAGTLGTDRGWDRRLTWAAPGSRVLVERPGWTLTVTPPPPLLLPEQDSADPEAGPRLRARLDAAASRVPPQQGQFLTLSGGFDSRALAVLLGRAHPEFAPPAITWGSGPGPQNPEEDSYIARRAAEALGLDHSYFQLDADVAAIRFEDFVTRFVRLGEGAIDHVPGYLDNFRIFDALRGRGLTVNLRADEVFGGRQTVHSEFHVRGLHNFLTLDDFGNCRAAPFHDIPQPSLGEYLRHEPGESLENLRDRLFVRYNVPVVQASLAELKSAFVEVVNPFLTDGIVEVCRALAPAQRTGKALVQEVLGEPLPGLPLARLSSTPPAALAWSMAGAAGFARDRLGAPEASALLPAALIRHLSGLVEAQPRPAPRTWRDRLRWLKPYLPDRLIGAAKRGQTELHLANQTLLMRALIICESEALMGDWAAKRLLA